MGDSAVTGRTIISVPRLDLSLGDLLSAEQPSHAVASSKTERQYARPGRRLVKKGVPHTARERPVVQQYPEYSSAVCGDVDDDVDVGRLIKDKLKNDDIKLLRRIHKQFVPVETKPRNTITHISKDAKQRNVNMSQLDHVSSQPLFIAKRIPLRTDRHAYSLSSKDVIIAADGDFMSVSIDRITTSDLRAKGNPHARIDLSQNVLAGDSVILYDNFNSMDWFENKALEGDTALEGGGEGSLYNIEDILNSSTYLSCSIISKEDFRRSDRHSPSSDCEAADFGPSLLHIEPHPPVLLKIEELAHKTAKIFKNKSSNSSNKNKSKNHSALAVPEYAASKYSLRNKNDDLLFLNSLIYGSTAHVNLDDITDAAISKAGVPSAAASKKSAAPEVASDVGLTLQSQRLLPSKEAPPPVSAEPTMAQQLQEQPPAPTERSIASALVPSQQPKKKGISFAAGVGCTPLKTEQRPAPAAAGGPSYVLSPGAGPSPQEGSEGYSAYLEAEARRKKRQDIVASCKAELTKRETAEIMVHKGGIYFLGDKAFKHVFDKRQKNNGYDDENDYYIGSAYDHLYFRYEIVERIHRGSCSALHKVNDRKSKRVYAVKVYRKGDRYFALAKNEEKILHILKADKAEGFVGIVTSFDFRGHCCIVMPLHSGPSLHAHLRSGSFEGLPAKRLKRALNQLLSCLIHLKKSNIIHCAIRPSSVLFKCADPLEVCLIDFTYSRLHSNNSSEDCGSAAQRRESLDAAAAQYLAPEVLEGKEASFAADVWSLGCTIFELATGSVLFAAGNTPASAPAATTSASNEEADAAIAARQIGFIRCLGDVGGPVNAPVTRHLRDYASMISDKETEQEAVIGVLQRMLRWDVEGRATAEELDAGWINTGVVNFVV